MKDTRKQVWVNPFQTQLFVRVGVYWLIYTFTLFNFMFIWRLLREGKGDLAEQFLGCLADNVPLFFCLAIVGPWLARDAVRFSNRLVGPLYRFKQTMQTIAGNEPVPLIRLRRGDFLLDMQDEFNAMIQSLQERGVIEVIPPPPSESAMLPVVNR
jgi:hypothetical protein